MKLILFLFFIFRLYAILDLDELDEDQEDVLPYTIIPKGIRIPTRPHTMIISKKSPSRSLYPFGYDTQPRTAIVIHRKKNKYPQDRLSLDHSAPIQIHKKAQNENSFDFSHISDEFDNDDYLLLNTKKGDKCNIKKETTAPAVKTICQIVTETTLPIITSNAVTISNSNRLVTALAVGQHHTLTLTTSRVADTSTSSSSSSIKTTSSSTTTLSSTSSTETTSSSTTTTLSTSGSSSSSSSSIAPTTTSLAVKETQIPSNEALFARKLMRAGLDETNSNSNYISNSFSGKNIYISNSKGSNLGDGSMEKPFTDLQFGLNLALPGDKIFLRKGDVFINEFQVKSNNIWIGSYSDDNITQTLPRITNSIFVNQGLKFEEGLNIEKYRIDSLMTDTKKNQIWAVWVNGFRYMPARFPNVLNPNQLYGVNKSEFIFIDKVPNGPTKIVYPDPSIFSKRDSSFWIGSTIRIRDTNWSYDRAKIVSVDLINMRFELSHPINLLFASGFYLENNVGYLDSPGEYYYDKNTKILSIYKCSLSICQPSALSPSDNGVWILRNGQSKYEMDGIGNLSHDYYSMEDPTSMPFGIKIQGNDVELNGLDISNNFIGVYSLGQRVKIINSILSHSLSSGILINAPSTASVSSCLIINSDQDGINNIQIRDEPLSGALNVTDLLVKNVALIAGYSWEGNGIRCGGCNVFNSEFYQMGYTAIHPFENSIIQNNVIINWARSLADTGAILTIQRSSGTLIRNNLIQGTNFANNMTFQSNAWGLGAGIFIDQSSTQVIVLNNTITATSLICLKVSSSQNIGFFGNKCMTGGFVSQLNAKSNLTNIKVTGNSFTRNPKYPVLKYQNMDRSSIDEINDNLTRNEIILPGCAIDAVAFSGLNATDIQIIKSKNLVHCQRI